VTKKSRKFRIVSFNERMASVRRIVSKIVSLEHVGNSHGRRHDFKSYGGRMVLRRPYDRRTIVVRFFCDFHKVLKLQNDRDYM